MSHYSTRSPPSKKDFALKESSLGTGTSHEAEEQVIPYLPSLPHNRIFKMVKETRGRLHGSRRDHFSRLDSVKSLTPMMATLTPKSTPDQEEIVIDALPNAPRSSLERFLELSNKSSMSSPRNLRAQSDCQRALPR
ncbi:hypothetical protein MHU86_24078 [Fragilaria crotonensis]|nr:hypothetical protein MHU86_24078 [Fragilaria crotonensis]